MTTTEPIEVTLAVTGVLERLGVEYLVGGSLATSLHGIPRATLDVDIVADLRMTHLDPFVAALREAFFVDHACSGPRNPVLARHRRTLLLRSAAGRRGPHCGQQTGHAVEKGRERAGSLRRGFDT
jgi:hypothetical protein